MKHAVPVLLMLLQALHAQAQAQAQAPADNCEPIRQHIEGRFRAGGVANPALVVQAAGSARTGRVVGTCGNGSRQIVLLGTGGTAAPVAASPAADPTDKIPTECKDGSIVIGPRCDDPRAARMTSAELAARPASQ